MWSTLRVFVEKYQGLFNVLVALTQNAIEE